MDSRDVVALKTILRYCEQVSQAQSLLGDTLESFRSIPTYQNACCMCILQIGEWAGRLSDEAQHEIKGIPWSAIRGMRNNLAHNYGKLNVTMTWKTICDDIPALQRACEEYLKQNP